MFNRVRKSRRQHQTSALIILKDINRSIPNDTHKHTNNQKQTEN